MTSPIPADHRARSRQVRNVRVEVQRARQKNPWSVEDVPTSSAARFFPANEVWQTDNSVGDSVVRAVPASSLIRETMAPPTIDAWPRKQNKISSLSQKPSDAENIPPLMKKLNQLVWEGLRMMGPLVKRCVEQYDDDDTVHDLDCDDSKAGAWSEVSSSRLAMEVIHRFMESVVKTGSPEERLQTTEELVEDNRRIRKVLNDVLSAVVRWSIFEQAGDVFSKCFSTYEAAISEVMKECADCVDDVLNTLVTEIVLLRKRLSQARAVNRGTDETIAKRVAERDEQFRRANEAVKHANEAAAKLAERDHELRKLQFELEDREKTIARQTDEMELMSKQFTSQEAKINKLSHALSHANEKIDGFTLQVADLKRNLAQAESVAASCASETLQLRHQLANINSAFQANKAELNKLKDQVKDGAVPHQLVCHLPLPPASLAQLPSLGGLAAQEKAVNTYSQQLQLTKYGKIINLDINEWMEVACKTYITAIETRLQADCGFDMNSDGGAFALHTQLANYRDLSETVASLGEMSQNNQAATENPVAASINSTAVHFPEMKARNHLGVQIVSVADEAARPFFIGMGDSPSVPAALRYIGKIPNMHFGPETVSNLIIAFFRDSVENMTRQVLTETFEPSHQMGHAKAIMSASARSRKAAASSSAADDFAPSSSSDIHGGGGGSNRPKSAGTTKSGTTETATADLLVNNQTKSLLHLVNDWMAFHLDCEDAVPSLYNILYAARWHSNLPVCRFFDSAVRFEAPAALWFAIGDTIELFRRTLEENVSDIFCVHETSVQEAVRKTFTASLNTQAIARISTAVHNFYQDAIAAAEAAAAASAPTTTTAQATTGGAGAGSSTVNIVSPDISLRSIFVSGLEFAKRKHRRLVIARTTKEATTSSVVWAADSVDENPIVQSIRNECIQAWFDVITEFSESILERAIVSPEGHATPYSVCGALLAVDPLRPKHSMDRIMKAIFGAEKITTTPTPTPAPPPPSSSSPLLPAGSSRSTGSGEQPQGEVVVAKQQTPERAPDEEDLTGTDYSEVYRMKQFADGDMIFVQDAIARLRMVPLARYTPPPDTAPPAERMPGE